MKKKILVAITASAVTALVIVKLINHCVTKEEE